MENEPADRVTVVICDDDYFTRQALNLLLKKAPGIDVIATCASATECLDIIAQQLPRVALVGMESRGDRLGGARLAREIRLLSPATVCAILTGSDLTGARLADAVKAGARGYYRTCELQGPELPNIVRNLAAGGWTVDAELARMLIRRFDADSAAMPISPSGRATRAAPHLTARERSILHMLADGTDAGGIASGLATSTESVRVAMHNIMTKFRRGLGDRVHVTPSWTGA